MFVDSLAKGCCYNRRSYSPCDNGNQPGKQQEPRWNNSDSLEARSRPCMGCYLRIGHTSHVLYPGLSQGNNEQAGVATEIAESNKRCKYSSSILWTYGFPFLTADFAAYVT